MYINRICFRCEPSMAGPMLQVGGLEGGRSNCNIAYLSTMCFWCEPQMAGPVLPGLGLEDELPRARYWIRTSGHDIISTNCSLFIFRAPRQYKITTEFSFTSLLVVSISREMNREQRWTSTEVSTGSRRWNAERERPR